MFTGLTSGLEIGKHAEGQKRIHGNLGIINGKKASIKKFPYMVALIIDGSLQGSGVILNSHWILTTAFNVAWVPSDEIEFRAGSTNYEQGGQTLTAEKVVVHENYTGSWDYDIAVVKLNKPIKLGKKAKPIKLGKKDLKGKTKVVASGWGPASEYGNPSPNLLSGELTVLDWNTCDETYPYDLTSRLMCTSDTNVAPCGVDFGDPIVYKKAVYGLYAGGYGCLTEPALFTDVVNLSKWVKSAIKQ
ncbi:Suppressor of tumorigenicity 14 protein [Homalodisca vitripennis]|nr:Suppressor of tumorigenicity 14 protein [Homalodisca vitripennis]